MLTITGITQGKCTWCLEQTEVVTAQFRDGLTGSFCKKHLWQALKCDAKYNSTSRQLRQKETADDEALRSRPAPELQPEQHLRPRRFRQA